MRNHSPFRSYSFFFLLISCALYSCIEREIQPSRAYIYPEIKNYFDFAPGSYWVYEDATMNLDSIVLGFKNRGFSQGCPEVEFSQVHYFIPGDTVMYDNYLSLDMIRYNGGGSFGEEGQPIYLFGKEEGFQLNGLTVGAQLDSLEIFDHVFYDVAIMHIDSESQFQQEFEYDTDLYFSPGIGIIRTITYDTVNGTQEKNLLRYDVNF
jgi:hypothetical protein